MNPRIQTYKATGRFIWQGRKYFYCEDSTLETGTMGAVSLFKIDNVVPEEVDGTLTVKKISNDHAYPSPRTIWFLGPFLMEATGIKVINVEI